MGFTVDTAMDYLGMTDDARDTLRRAYSQPHRKYHNLEHLNNMLRWVENPPPNTDLAAILEGILYHDVYNEVHPILGYNEAVSVSMYSIGALVGANTDITARCERMSCVIGIIIATAFHTKDQTLLSKEAQFVLDLDLQSFAQPREEFLCDSENVKAEYLASNVKESDFILGNKAFLSTLLQRQPLYYLHPQWEQPARENLVWRLASI